jgi:hypothetical protein
VAQDLGDAEHNMMVGHGLDNTGAKPFAELHHAFLMTRRVKMPSVARKGQ